MTLTTGREIELAAAVLLLGLSVWLYRSQRKANQGYGSQGAVLLLVIGAIMAIHALGLLKYHPSKAEAEYLQEHSQ
jgi:hypothetical protein